jgi:regulator of sirC expression with transglutaminase-like and TPR domain
VKLSAHLKVSSVYTSLAQSAARSYPQKILMASEDASSAAQQLFRMPLPKNEYEAKQEAGYRVDMAFAALRFLNDRYGHVVEQRNDVVKLKDWANILKREGRVEDGAIAIARASDAAVEPANVYMELDRIAELVRDRLAKLEAAEIVAQVAAQRSLAKLQPSAGRKNSEAVAPAEPAQVRASEPEHNRYSLQEVADAQVPSSSLEEVKEGARQRSMTSQVLPGGHPENRYSLLHAAALVAVESMSRGDMPLDTAGAAASPDSGFEASESFLVRSYAAAAAAEEQGVDGAAVAAAAAGAGALPPSQVPLALRALNEVLFDDMGFVGNRQDYYNPTNSMIHNVLETRQGNPITLSVIYLALAQRVGLSLTGAECPSHFIVRGCNDDGEMYFVDVFNKGKIMSLASCKQMFLTARSTLLTHEDLSPVTPLQIYSRIMRNLVNSNMILGNGDKALLWTERLRVLEQVDSAFDDCTYMHFEMHKHTSRAHAQMICILMHVRTFISPFQAFDIVVIVMHACTHASLNQIFVSHVHARTCAQAHSSLMAPAQPAQCQKDDRGWRGRLMGHPKP